MGARRKRNLASLIYSGLLLTCHANPRQLKDALAVEEANIFSDVGVKGKVGEKVGEKITLNQILILKLLKKTNRLSARELAIEVGISSRKIEQNIARLKKLEKLLRIGPAKGGYWEVL